MFVSVYLRTCTRETIQLCLWERRVREDEGKLRDVKEQEQTEIDKI